MLVERQTLFRKGQQVHEQPSPSGDDEGVVVTGVVIHKCLEPSRKPVHNVEGCENQDNNEPYHERVD